MYQLSLQEGASFNIPFKGNSFLWNPNVLLRPELVANIGHECEIDTFHPPNEAISVLSLRVSEQVRQDLPRHCHTGSSVSQWKV